jgi:diketogulonate reductase-like aldo/keto reductase
MVHPTSKTFNSSPISNMSSHTEPKLQNGSPVPHLIYGTSIHSPSHPQPDIVQAIKSGFRGVDTACSRQFHDESRDGESIRTALSERITSRESLLIQTKYTSPYGQPGDDQASWPYDIKDSHSLRVLKSISRSIKDLKVDSIDVYFLHSPLETLDETREVWRTLEDVVSRGGVRYLGICHVSRSVLEGLWDQVNIKPAFVQNSFHRHDDAGFDVDVVRFCRQRGIVYQIFGLFSPRNEMLFQSDLVRDLMKQGATMHQALMRALMEAAKTVGLHLCILSGTTAEDHMEENVKALEIEFNFGSGKSLAFLQLLGWDKL